MAQRVRVIPATIDRTTSAPIASAAKRKVAGYARVSTEQEEQQSSYEAQVSYYTDYIKRRTDWVFVNVYTDEGISATSTKHREGFQQMVADAMAGKIDLIVTKSVSRFARNTVDSLTTIRQLKEHGTEVFFEKENIWTFDSKGELLLTIMSSLAQEESRSISENVRWGQRKKAADGKYSLPYAIILGYDKGPNGEPIINQEQAVIVRKIYGLFLEGYSYNRIAGILTEEGIPTVTGKDHWNDVTVASILSNELYMGDKVLQKTYSVDFLHKNRLKNKGQVPMYRVEQDHEAIIPPETFRRVQDEIARRKEVPVHGLTVFSGKIFCGCCGSVFGSKVWHSNDRYRRVIWQCNNKYKGAKICRMPHLYDDNLQADFVKVCQRLSVERDEVIGNLHELQQLIGGTDELEKQKAELEAELDFIGERLQALIDHNARVAMNQEVYKVRFDELSGQYQRADERVKEIEQTILKKELRQRQVKDVIQTIEGMPEIVTEFSPELWATLVKKVTVYGKGDLRFTLASGAEVRA